MGEPALVTVILRSKSYSWHRNARSRCVASTMSADPGGGSWFIVSMLGSVVFLFWMLRGGDEGFNRFGSDRLSPRDGWLVAASA